MGTSCFPFWDDCFLLKFSLLFLLNLGYRQAVDNSMGKLKTGTYGSTGEERYQLLPPLSRDEYAALKADIEKNGVQVPVVIDEEGEVIDGHHRMQIARELGVFCPTIVKEGLSAIEKRRMARTLNMQRRQLSTKQKRLIIAEELTEDPSQSNNSLAKRLGVSDMTVASVRSEYGLHQSVHVGADGKKYAASSWTRPSRDQTNRLREEYVVHVTCDSEEHQEELLRRFMGEGLKCRAIVS